jgi:hypothetical protein
MQKRIWVLLISGLLASVGAFGQTLEFVIGTSGGTYTYAGGGGSLGGSDITVLQVIVTGTTGSSPNGTYNITDGELNLTSGALSSVTSVSGVDVFTFNGGGTLDVQGCIAGVTGTGGGGACTASDDTADLLGDDFTSIEISNVSGVQVQAGNLNGTYLGSLATAFGVNTSIAAGTDNDTVTGVPVSGSSATSFTANNSGGGALTTTAAAVPEDWSLSSTLGLFGFGIVVFVVARRFGLKPLAF